MVEESLYLLKNFKLATSFKSTIFILDPYFIQFTYGIYIIYILSNSQMGSACFYLKSCFNLIIFGDFQYIGSMEIPRPSSRVEIVAAMRRVRVKKFF